VSERFAIAVDGGNSKTDLALVREDGEVLAAVRGSLSSPHHLGLDGALDVLESLRREAADKAGKNGSAAIAQLLLAGVDFPAEEVRVRDAITERGWAETTRVGNDTFAVLRAGTERGWGVAVVCGAGINCVGVGPDGRHARFPALGAITGDWGGGYDLGLAAVSAAARSEDGRGAKTSLEHAVPAHFGLQTPLELAEAVHTGRIAMRRMLELAPLLLAAADHDEVAAEIVDRLADEVVALARAALVRLEMIDEPAEVLLGGGVLSAAAADVVAAIEERLRRVAPLATVRRAESPPVVGAALLALDELGADATAQRRLREELGAAVVQLEDKRAPVEVE
jgi:N-acetylglucosamine kinase-like BadF-type ATPase